MRNTLYAELTSPRWRLFLRRNRGLLILAAVGLLLNAGFYLLRPNGAVMDFVIAHITTPFKHAVSYLCCLLPFSVAELIWYAAGLFALVYLLRMLVLIFVGRDRLWGFVRRALVIVCALLVIVLGCNLLWGANYYGSSLEQKSGLSAQAVSAEELDLVLGFFVQQANELCTEAARDADGHFAVSRSEILERSEGIYDNISKEFAFLSAPHRRPKPMLLSRLYSWMGFTGFYFPLTAEANLNTDSPAMLLPSTTAHEMAHQRGIAPEQEANFVAIVACTSSGDELYAYSAALLAYIHLGNALYKADYDLWFEHYSALDPLVRLDLADYSAYWKQFEGEVSDSAGKVYESYLHSYDQDLGLKSYGACVDLLVAYYKERL